MVEVSYRKEPEERKVDLDTTLTSAEPEAGKCYVLGVL